MKIPIKVFFLLLCSAVSAMVIYCVYITDSNGGVVFVLGGEAINKAAQVSRAKPSVDSSLNRRPDNISSMPKQGESNNTVTTCRLQHNTTQWNTTPTSNTTRRVLSTFNVTTPLLTLFTTFKYGRDNIQSNVIRNWGALYPYVQPIAFMARIPVLSQLAEDNHWIILPPARNNSHGTPFLKEMYKAVLGFSKSPYYGYCNGDILFTYGIIKTTIAAYNKFGATNTSLIIGRRTNLKVNPNDTKPFFDLHDVKRSQPRGQMFRIDAEDYFIISNVEGFLWNKMKDVVVGRPGYDNYLVGLAILANLTVIDATKTLLAVHQTGTDGNFAGSRNTDNHYNHRVIGGFNYNAGTTSGAFYETNTGANGTVIIRDRHNRRKGATPIDKKGKH